MKEKLEQIKAEAVAKIQEADVPEKLNDVRVKFLGKKRRTDSRIERNERCCPGGTSEGRTACK